MILYTGVVENRFDPTMLGRCQVRIVGLHTENKKDLPTEMLPWAYPMQPLTSAAMNGIGQTPLGPVEGTWVVVFFRDDEKQQPIMLGTVGGIPQSKTVVTNYIQDGDDYLLKTENGEVGSQTPPSVIEGGSNSTTPDQTDTTDKPDQYLGILTQEDVEKYKIVVARLETTSEPNGPINFTTTGTIGEQNYGVVNAFGRIGKYQLTGIALNNLGYVGKVLNANGETDPPSNFKLADDTVWLSKDGLTSVISFLGNAENQEKIMEEWTKFNYDELKRLSIITDETDKKVILGYLHVSHADGVTRAQALKQGQESQDSYGNTATSLYKLGYAALEGDEPKTLPQNVPPGVDPDAVPIGEEKPDGTPSTGSSGNTQYGFSDPSAKYPLKDFLNEPDTNRLARHEQISKTIVGLKDSTRTLKVPLSWTQATWNQPESPYNAQYPFNHVYESEAGHFQEFDNTPNNERIHTYHKKGTFSEIDANGTQVNKIIGDGYQIIDRNGYIYVRGAHNCTVDGVTNLYMRSDANIEVTGDANILVKNDVTMRVSGKFDLTVKENMNIKCAQFNVQTDTLCRLEVGSDFYLSTAEKINMTSNNTFNLRAENNMSLSTAGNLFTTSTLSTSVRAERSLNLSATANDVNIYARTNVNVLGESVLNLRGGEVAQRAGTRFDISTPNTLSMSGGIRMNLNSGGLGTVPPVTIPISLAAEVAETFPITWLTLKEATDRETPVNAFFDHLSLPPRGLPGGSVFETPEEGDPSEFISKRKNSGDMSKNESRPNSVETSPAPKDPPPQGKIVTCDAFKEFTEFPLNTKLSANFYLGDFIPGGGPGYICVASKPHKLQDQDGLTKAQIVCNLKALAENVLESIIKIVPKSDILITSGYRQKGLLGVESATSQHPKGMAVDIVLKKTAFDRKKHFDLINEIRAKVPHDQLLLEYTDPKTVWIHISYNQNGKNRNVAFTMNNHRKTNDGHTLLV
jgi:hypothetical protein